MYTEEQVRRWFLNLRHFDAAARLRKHPLCQRSSLLKPSAIVAVSGWTEAWRNRQLSNFEYVKCIWCGVAWRSHGVWYGVSAVAMVA